MIDYIEPDNISDEQESWSTMAEGLLRQLLWRIETGQVKPKELAVVFLDRMNGKRTLVTITTDHDRLRLTGLMHLGAKRLGDRILYDEA